MLTPRIITHYISVKVGKSKLKPNHDLKQSLLNGFLQNEKIEALLAPATPTFRTTLSRIMNQSFVHLELSFVFDRVMLQLKLIYI